MYKINFYDCDNNFLATHLISAEDLPLEKKCVEDYCLMIASVYPFVFRWTVFQYSNYILFSGCRS